MYQIMIYAHSWLRWIIVIAGLLAAILAIGAWMRNRGLKKNHRILNGVFVGSLHLELILGLTLYLVYSKLVVIGDENMGAIMKDSTLRYWNVEHITTMIIAVVIAQVGSSSSRRAKVPRKASGRAALFFSIAMLLILVTIPWPFKGRFQGKPYFRTQPPPYAQPGGNSVSQKNTEYLPLNDSERSNP